MYKIDSGLKAVIIHDWNDAVSHPSDLEHCGVVVLFDVNTSDNVIAKEIKKTEAWKEMVDPSWCVVNQVLEKEV